jgi:TolA-binding protein
MELIEGQKLILEQELNQNNKRIETLNEIRKDQEQRVQQAGNYKAPREQAYASIEKANNEIQAINIRNQQLQEDKFKKDADVLELKNQISQAKDIGTFKFFADYVNKPLDTVVIWFILCLMCVFDPLAVSLVLAFNTAIANRSASPKKSTSAKSSVTTNNVNESTNNPDEIKSTPNIIATGYAIPRNR